MSETGREVEIVAAVKGNGDDDSDAFLFLKTIMTSAPLSSIEETVVVTRQDDAASISGGENCEATHCPHATEARIHGIRAIVGGREAIMENDDGRMHVFDKEANTFKSSVWLRATVAFEAVAFEELVKFDTMKNRAKSKSNGIAGEAVSEGTVAS